MSTPSMRPLVVGERVRFEGDTCEVVRVSPCAAYLRHERTRTVTVTDRHTGQERSFTARDSGLVAVSINASVRRVSS